MKTLRASLLFLLAAALPAPAARVVAIGDSLTAEYDTIPEVPGFSREATRYAEITEDGWESMSWVEVLSRLRRAHFDFGGYRELSRPWGVPRLSGYELNWGIPGIAAGQYAEFLTSSARSNFAYWFLRQPLELQLSSQAKRVVIWLGGNEFRANYGTLYDGASSESLIRGLIDDLERIVDAVQEQNPRAQIVLGNIPDLGATPDKRAAHPDPQRRARVTAATEAANARIAKLASDKGVALADVYAQTARLVRGGRTYFGAVEILNASDEDNDPHYHFTRDGLHPNTPSQVELARIFIRAFNRSYRAAIPQITDAEALEFLGIDPNEPFFDWLAEHDASGRGVHDDPEGDGLSHLIEYAFGLNPAQRDADRLPVRVTRPASGIAGEIEVRYTPDPGRSRHVRVKVQHSSNGTAWQTVPLAQVTSAMDGSFTARLANDANATLLRVRVTLVRPSGSATLPQRSSVALE